MTDPTPIKSEDNPTITLEWKGDRLHITTSGNITPDGLILGSHYLRRTADQLLDATALAPHEPRGIVRAASIPEGIQRRD
jgi:hypothetical protein